MPKELLILLSEITKSKFALPTLVFVTFIFLIFLNTPVLACLYYVGILFLVCILAIFIYYIVIKIGMTKKKTGSILPKMEPLLANFLKILDKKGIKILKDIERSIKNLQKKAYFILESGESSPDVRVDKYLFSWNEILSGNKREVQNFLKDAHNLRFKNAKMNISDDNSTITFEKGKKSLKMNKHARNVTMEINDGRYYDYILRRGEGQFKVYERLSTRPTFFAQFMKKNVEQDNIFRFPLIGTSSFLVFADNISDEKIIKDYRKFVKNKYNEIINHLRERNNRYLFSWGNITKKDRQRFLKFLNDDLSINWTRPRIKKSDDNNTITVKKGKNSLRVYRQEENVKIEISDGRTYDYISRQENGNLNIYEDRKKTFEKWYSNFENTSNLILVTRPYGFSIDYAIELFSSKMNKQERNRLLKKMMDVIQQKVVIHNIMFSYLFEAAGFDEEIIEDFREIETEIVEKMGNEYGDELNEKDYFSRLLTKKDFIKKFEKCLKSTNSEFYNRISNCYEFDKLKNLIEYIHNLLKADVYSFSAN